MVWGGSVGHSERSILLIGIFALMGCGGEEESVSGTASIFNGATPVVRGSTEHLKNYSPHPSRSSGN